jgi:hypothetical protein
MTTRPCLAIKTFLIACCCLLSLSAFTQTSTDSLFTGFGNFRLGDPQSKFGNDLTLIKGSDTTKPEHSPYGYGYSGTKPAATNPPIVTFEIFMAFFDRNKTLAQVTFMNLYGVKHGRPPFRQGKKDYKLLHTWFADKLQQPGKKVVYYDKRNSYDEGYEWETATAKLILKLNISSYKRKTAGIQLYLEKKKE